MISQFKPEIPNERDNDILLHTFRMGMTTQVALHRMFFAGKTLNAVSQVTSRLVKQGYLNRYQLLRTSNYYTLGQRCVRLFGAPRNKTTPRGEQILPVDFGTLAYCCLDDVVRKRLLPNEILKSCHWFPKNQLGQPYYYDHTNGLKRLATIRVEMCDYPDFIVKKHMRQIHRLRETPELRQLIESGAFMIVTITTTPERREAVIKEISRNTFYPPFAVLDFPDLLNLL